MKSFLMLILVLVKATTIILNLQRNFFKFVSKKNALDLFFKKIKKDVGNLQKKLFRFVNTY